MKLYLSPHLDQVKDNNGIGRIIIAQHKHLPGYGVEIVTTPNAADVIAAHINGEWLERVDICHSHGLHWSDIPHDPYLSIHHEVNKRIAITARRALAITTPSEWVAQVFKRDMRVTPTVIGHGIDPLEWHTDKKRKEPFVLWSKSRDGDVCNPLPAWELAKRGVPVITTFNAKGKTKPESMTITGGLLFPEMKALLEQATVYLATTFETFGIQTLEAMASGTPVLGYAWGGTKDIVRHKIDGWLAEPHDIDGLMEGLQYILDNWQTLAQNTRQRAEQYTWPALMEQYAALYQRVAGEVTEENDRVSVIITNYNYGRWVGAAIESVLSQLQTGDELIIIDDGSTDNSRETLASYETDQRTKVIFTENHGVAHARNLGISLASNPFIGCLDADDRYHPNFLRATRPILAKDRGLGVVYVGLDFYDENETQIGTWNPAPAFDWEYQTRVVQPPTPPSTMIPTPSACLFRKTMWARAGGYNQAYKPAEDTEFMMRGLSVGFTAQPVKTDAKTLYREHPYGASKAKADNPHPYQTSIYTWHPWTQDKKYPFAAPSENVPTVNSYALPLVSVLIPVAEKHLEYLPSALDSLLGQTFRNWEVIVVTDNCALPEKVKTVYPFLKSYASTGKGVSEARNTGLAHVAAPLVLFLDADDWLDPRALEKLVLKYSQAEGRYVYPDGRGHFADGRTEPLPFLDYEPRAYFARNLHSITVLMETETARKLQFSPHMRGYEDWDFFLRAAIAGYHGVRLPEPLVNIRRDAGHFQDVGKAERQMYIDEYLKKHYQEYQTGAKAMAGCCGGGGSTVLRAKQEMAGQIQRVETVSGSELVRMEYTGTKAGAFTVNVNGKAYRMSNSPFHRAFEARPGDVEKLLMTVEGLRIVRAPNSLQPFSITPPSSPPSLNLPPENPRIEPVPTPLNFTPKDWGNVAKAESPLLTPDNDGKLEIKPANQGDYAVREMTISEVKTAIESGMDSVTLFGWLEAEQTAEKPRKGVLDALEKALER